MIVYNGAGLVFSQGAVLTVQTLVRADHHCSIRRTSPSSPARQAEICMTFGGTPPFDVQLQRWNGPAWTPGVDALLHRQHPGLLLRPQPLTLADNGAQYLFLIDNPAGEVGHNTATVTVQAPSGITTTTLASRATSGATANNRSGLPSLSSDGNIVAFISDGTNLVPGFGGYPLASSNGYVRNISTGITTLVNVDAGRHAISIALRRQRPETRRGRTPRHLHLARGGSRCRRHQWLAGRVRARSADRHHHACQPASRWLGDHEFSGNGQSDMQVNISADGRFVSFVSSQDLIGDDPSGAYSLYFRSLQTGFLRRVFSSTTTLAAYSALSDNGEHLAYLYGTFVPGDTRNIIVHYDTEANSSEEVFSIDSTNNASYVAQGIGISGNGRYITFSVAFSHHVQWIEFHSGHGDRPERSRPDHRCEWWLQWFRQWPQQLAQGVG